ncbi:uncharacterized protein [Miscanthus floridulus]|uniref:uncharacterized protein isoform X3 n=1 Tax=Miscanthus floridulus TaxID=154761 RepID=UPI003458AFFC
MTSSGEGCPAVEVSCEGERAEVAVSGEGERAAVAASGESGLAGESVSGEGVLAGEAVSGEGGRAAEALSGEGGGAVAVSGKGKGKRKRDLLFSLDYPCTERLRLRRLLAYLREYWCDQTYDVAKEKMLVIFHTEDLVEKVKAGQWREAFHYVRNFAPITQSSKEADFLSLFLEHLMAISGFADGNTMVAGIVCDWFRRIYRHPVLDKYPFFATIVDVLFLRAQHLSCRNSLDWQLVRNKAAEMVEEMANKTPELKDRMRYPRGQNDLYDVMPVRSSFRQRRQVKNLGQKQSTELAQFYLQLKKRLPSSSQPETHADSGSKRGDGEILISLLDKALQAGRQMVSKEAMMPSLTVKAKPDPFSKQGHQLEYATKQAAMMRWRSQESHRCAAHAGNDSKRPRTTRNFGDERRPFK